jgi:dihydrofolate synthase / folylpolyglutamate synthase
MNYKQTLNYLYEQLPMFHRIGAAAYKANLDNTHALMDLLHHPHLFFDSVHVAGTNGKGSTSHMIASILQHAGYKVGLYTSPHLKDFRERIRVNGKMISKKSVCDFVEQYKTDCEKIQLSFFEWTVGLAFDYFKNQKVDIAIIETGLGGRLDSTNVITPLVSIITNISLDHQNLLGNTVQKIAKEKAGIIKKNIPVIIGKSDHETDNVFIRKSKSVKTEIYFADKTYTPIVSKSFKTTNEFLNLNVRSKSKIVYKNLKLDLTGNYQTKNLPPVLKCVDLLKPKYPISNKAIYKGLVSVKATTDLQGRWQILSKNPLVICDTGHNEDGIKEVLKNIKHTPHHQLHFVLGMVNDKDIEKILSLLPSSAQYYFCKANIPRGMDATFLKEKASKFKLNGIAYSSVRKALKAAQINASAKDLIFVGGSTFTVAEVV